MFFYLQRLETWRLQTSVMAELLRPSAPASPSSLNFPSCKQYYLITHYWTSGSDSFKFICRDFSFTSFSVHGSIWNSDGEFWSRKGIGRVRLEPAVNFTVDIFLTSLCADDSNTYYRQIQAAEFGEALRNSDADFVLGILPLVLPKDL